MILICNLYKLRTERNLSLRKLSNLCHVSKSYLNKLENNNIENPSFPLCRKIVLALDVTYDQLFTFEGEEHSVVIDFEGYKKSKKFFTDKEAANAYSDYLDDSQKYMVTRMIIHLTEKRSESKEE